MDIRISFLKAETKLTAEQVKILRKYEKFCQRNGTINRGFSNSKEENIWDRRREDGYVERKRIGQEARYLGLASAYAKGKVYSNVERWTRPNNVPDVGRVFEKLTEFGFRVNPVHLQEWLEI